MQQRYVRRVRCLGVRTCAAPPSCRRRPFLQTSHRVCEPDAVNTNVTAPAAIMAMTLAFLMTNNSAAAQTLRVPASEVGERVGRARRAEGGQAP